MKKYWQIFKISWQNSLVYRFNFFMWRLRTIIGFLSIYFFWSAVFRHNQQVFDYSRAALLTYIVIARFADTLVFSNTSYQASAEIANGNLNNYLLRPAGYLKQWFARDLADKILNLIFFALEIVILVVLLQPPLIFPSALTPWLKFIFTSLFAGLIYFYFSFIVSAFTFWYPEYDGWPLRFVLWMFLEFLTGAAFPLDILPPAVFNWFKWLPFGYLVYFPSGFYLERFGGAESVRIWLTMAGWLVIFYYLTRLIWKKGLKIYGAYGR